MPKYIAFTIGPIFKTITRQRKTRSIFAASYLFSYIMKTMIDKIAKKDAKLQRYILTPTADYLDNPKYQKTGCGLYPDRFIMRTDSDDTVRTVLKARDETLKHLEEEFREDGSPVSKEYLEQYLVIYLMEIETEEGEDTIDEINDCLNSLELHANFPTEEDNDGLQSFFDETKAHFLLRDAFGSKKTRFESLPEIAVREFSHIPKYKYAYQKVVIEDHFDDDDNFYRCLNDETGNAVQLYHKYIAVVNADGDNFGKYVGNLKANKNEMQRFSKKLMEFGIEAKRLIEDYGGASVYIGGDDLLFFAPLVARPYGTRQTIFELIKDLDNEFYKHFEPKENPPSPTLSYGISLTYYKYPLNEALQESYELLQQIKDNYTHKDKKKHPNKNAIAFKVLKHSGQFFEAVIDKEKPKQVKDETEKRSLYKHFEALISNYMLEDAFINSLTHNMSFFQDLFGELLLNITAKSDAEREEEIKRGEKAIDQLFANNLNESIHKEPKNKKFIDAVVEYIKVVYEHLRTVPDEAYVDDDKKKQAYENKSNEALKIIYSTLRFIHFVRDSNLKKQENHG